MKKAIGGIGVLGATLLAGGFVFLHLALQPLEARSEALQAELAARSQPGGRGAGTPNLATLYKSLQGDANTGDWLARLHAIGAATGVELRAAEYKQRRGEGRIERYEVSLSASGNYPQLRAFLAEALEQLPLLSLDQVKFRRRQAEDATVQADIQLTFHTLGGRP